MFYIFKQMLTWTSSEKCAPIKLTHTHRHPLHVHKLILPYKNLRFQHQTLQPAFSKANFYAVLSKIKESISSSSSSPHLFLPSLETDFFLNLPTLLCELPRVAGNMVFYKFKSPSSMKKQFFSLGQQEELLHETASKPHSSMHLKK